MDKKFPSQTQDKFTVRFPDGLRDKIAELANKNGRSMNSEIIDRLEKSFQIDEKSGFFITEKTVDTIKDFFDNTSKKLEQIEKQVAIYESILDKNNKAK